MAQLQPALVEITGWKAELISSLLVLPAFGASQALGSIDRMERLLTVGILARRAGVAPGKLQEYADSQSSEAKLLAAAQELRAALKAKYTEKTWESVRAERDDRLLNARREALVGLALEIAPLGITNPTPDDLYQYLLIDVQMTAVMRTSRIREAIGSVQLFVQRCHLNLENDVSPAAIDPDRWAWMKNYRVWEANRRVFLYPENYVEPELRLDKSPFFREFEEELLQGEMTTETVENAFDSYLRKLDSVARLRIVAHRRDLGRNVQHVVGRTADDPPIHYYRRFEDNAWSAWERIPVEISSDQVILVVNSQRLYLYWAQFAEKTCEPEDSQLDKNAETAQKRPLKRWDVTLAWTEYRNGKWSPKNATTGEKGSTSKPKSIGNLSIVQNRGITDRNYREDLSDYRLSAYGGPYGDLYRPVGTNFGTAPGWKTGGTAFQAIVLQRPLQLDGPDLYDIGRWAANRANGPLRASFTTGSSTEGITTTSAPQFWRIDGQQWKLGGYFMLQSTVGGPAELTKPGYGFLEVPLLGETSPECRVLFGQPDEYTRAILPHFPLFFQDDDRQYFLTVRPSVVYSFKFTTDLYPEAVNMLSLPTALHLRMLYTGAMDLGILARYVPHGSGSGSGLLGGLPPFISGGYAITTEEGRIHFQIHYHPYVTRLISELNSRGTDGVLSVDNQETWNDGCGTFNTIYKPISWTHPDHPKEEIDFSPDGTYSIYNWELYYHLPMLVAERFSREQRFEDAQRWLHYIFDPTATGEAPIAGFEALNFWRILPFRYKWESTRIQDILAALGDPTSNPEKADEIVQQIGRNAKHPFDPHGIARLRIEAYQRATFFLYLKNLVSWGDYLFSQDTWESLEEATQLYVLASELLGPRPERVPAPSAPVAKTYEGLRDYLDEYSNASVNVEDWFGATSVAQNNADSQEGMEGEALSIAGLGQTLYFGVPPNSKLNEFWDAIQDRLFKIRHGLDIHGVARKLALFSPPIDPMALVKATASGLGISSALADLASPLGNYRFPLVFQKAMELCHEVKAFGGALLSALEKKDAEYLGNLRARQETQLLTLIQTVKQKQIDEAAATLQGLERSRATVEFRRNYYASLERVNAKEREHLALSDAAMGFQVASQVGELLASVVSAVPQFTVGVAGSFGSPVGTAAIGGSTFGPAAQAAARGLGILGAIASQRAARAATMGGWDRRWDDWQFQKSSAELELNQLDKQIEAAKIRLNISETELRNHQQQMSNAADVEAFLKTKYTNEELYQWTIGQVKTLYFQLYQLAYRTAKQAERAYRFERVSESSSYIQYGYWDSGRAGLLAGEKLSLSLRQLEKAYLDENVREQELAKTISLAQIDPYALVELQETGSCLIDLPEALFDLDYPSHYLRRIKTVTVTIPCVVGPHQNVNARLSLLSSKIRRKDGASSTSGDFLQDFTGASPFPPAAGRTMEAYLSCQ